MKKLIFTTLFLVSLFAANILAQSHYLYFTTPSSGTVYTLTGPTVSINFNLRSSAGSELTAPAVRVKYPNGQYSVYIALSHGVFYSNQVGTHELHGNAWVRDIATGTTTYKTVLYFLHVVEPPPPPPLAAAINGPLSIQEGVRGTWTAIVSGGSPPYSYDWSYYKFCGGSEANLTMDEESPKFTPTAPPCGFWLSLGSTTYQVSRYDYENFKLKCVVTDDDNDTYTTTQTVIVLPGSQANIESESDKITSSLKENSELGLGNYPNPFNPTTRISFSIPNSGNVVLKVYNILGKEVMTLNNGFLQAGTHEFAFDASNLPSGTYIYSLTAGGENITKKMQLVK